jgi:hypothetical protein
MKPDNVLVNYGQGETRFADVELADCGSTVHADSALRRTVISLAYPYGGALRHNSKEDGVLLRTFGLFGTMASCNFNPSAHSFLYPSKIITFRPSIRS